MRYFKQEYFEIPSAARQQIFDIIFKITKLLKLTVK